MTTRSGEEATMRSERAGPIRRALIVTFALSITAAGLGFGFAALGEPRPAAFAQTHALNDRSLIAFTASKPEPAPEGGIIMVTGGEEPRPTSIYVARPDGSNRRRLTGASLMKGSLAWSPDGSMLAFTTFDPNRNSERLSIMSPTGAGRRVLCKNCTATFWVMPQDEVCIDWCERVAPFSDRLAWSPDGRWLAAPRTLEGGLSLIDITTGEVRAIRGLGAVTGASWSSDSSSVAVSVDGAAAGLFIVDLDDDDDPTTRLYGADPYSGSPPAWSPDGSTIAFGQAARVRGDLYAELIFVDARDGSSRKVLGTDDLFEVYDLEWSPDGSQLAVLHHPVDPPTAALLTMASDGSDVRMVALCENGSDLDRLCASNGGSVAWSPDGRRLAFRNYDGRRSAVVALPIGGEAVPISGRLVPECCLAWSPAA